MELLTNVVPLCIFDIVHASRLAEGNLLVWLGGISAGLVLSGFLTYRAR